MQVAESTAVNGLKETVPPKCTYTTPATPAADVAAHSAAALALSSQVVKMFLQSADNSPASPAGMLATAEALYGYSKTKASLQQITPKQNATDTAPPSLGVRSPSESLNMDA